MKQNSTLKCFLNGWRWNQNREPDPIRRLVKPVRPEEAEACADDMDAAPACYVWTRFLRPWSPATAWSIPQLGPSDSLLFSARLIQFGSVRRCSPDVWRKDATSLTPGWFLVSSNWSWVLWVYSRYWSCWEWTSIESGKGSSGFISVVIVRYLLPVCSKLRWNEVDCLNFQSYKF